MVEKKVKRFTKKALYFLFAIAVLILATRFWGMRVLANASTATIGSFTIAVPNGVTQADVTQEPSGIYLSTNTLYSGWYYVPATDLELSYLNLDANQEINIILLDGHTLTINDSLRESTATLRIWGQAEGTGKLIVKGQYKDYGYGYAQGYGIYVKNLVINGGNVKVTGAASNGVGHGVYITEEGGALTYNDGTLIASSGSRDGEIAISASNITINNSGTVKAGANAESIDRVTRESTWGTTLSSYKYVEISPYNPVTVSFDANGGKGSMSDVEIEKGQYTLPTCTIKPPLNKEFDGWALSSTGSKITTSKINVSENTTLYALWKNHTHQITTVTISEGVTRKSCRCGYYVIKFD